MRATVTEALLGAHAGMTTVLDGDAWRERRRAHEARVDAWTAGHRERAAAGRPHPVEDFLFTYYSHRPAHLRRWSPGPGVALADADELLGRAHFTRGDDGLVLLVGPPDGRRAAAAWIADLSARVAGRPAFVGCFGLHEWAMVYRQAQQDVRHRDWPLRLGEDGTAAVVEALPVRCGHVDAYRFFTPAARPLNLVMPTRETQAEHDQPGCLHVAMDLYKWAYKLSPWIASELVADCFALARQVRELDMRASPYDFSALGYAPVAIETPAGRAEYAAAQRGFAERSAPLRARVEASARRVAG